MIALKIIALIIKMVRTRCRDLAPIAVQRLRGSQSQFRGTSAGSAAGLSLFGLMGFIYSLIGGISQNGIWLLLAIVFLWWMAWWGYVTYFIITSQTWPLETPPDDA